MLCGDCGMGRNGRNSNNRESVVKTFVVCVLLLLFTTAVAQGAEKLVITVDKTITADDGQSYLELVHFNLNGKIYPFTMTCLRRFPDCRPLQAGDKFDTIEMDKDDPDRYPDNTDSCCSLRVTGENSSMVYFVVDPKMRARDQLNKGVTAYKDNHYEQAIDHFQSAAQLDPTLINAHMYLATAYVSQYIPGVDSPANLRTAQQAIDEYQKVLHNPSAAQDQKVNSAKGIAYLYLNQKKWDDAKKYYRMASDMDPYDPEPYYSVGVIDWTACYQLRMEERAKLGLRPEENLNPKNKDQKKVCDELKVKNTPAIQEGVGNLNKAIQLRPDYDDAMAYMNLMYRERADVECNDLNARRGDLKTADDWVDQTLLTKKAKAEKQPGQQRMTMDQSK